MQPPYFAHDPHFPYGGAYAIIRPVSGDKGVAAALQRSIAMISKRLGPDGTVRVTFAMPASIWADTIHVVGDFNGWDEHATPLRQLESGWMVTLELQAGQAYNYRYLLNGNEWHNDWNADGYVSNAYGGDNSVVLTPTFPAYAASDPGERVLSFTSPHQRLVSTG